MLDLPILLYSLAWMLDVEKKKKTSLAYSCYNTSTAIILNMYLNFNEVTKKQAHSDTDATKLAECLVTLNC